MPNATVTITGNLTADPELRFTPSGAAVANFTVASTERILDRQTNEWRDGDTVFLRVTAWRELGEGAADTLRRGNRVTVVGKLKQRSFETREGEKRTVIEADADDILQSVRKRSESSGRQQQSAPAGDSGPGW